MGKRLMSNLKEENNSQVQNRRANLCLGTVYLKRKSRHEIYFASHRQRIFDRPEMCD